MLEDGGDTAGRSSDGSGKLHRGASPVGSDKNPLVSEKTLSDLVYAANLPGLSAQHKVGLDVHGPAD